MKIATIVACSLSAMHAHAQYTAEILFTPSGRGRAMAAGGGQIVGVALGTGGGPALWDGPGHSLVSLSTPGYTGVVLQGVGGGTQVGYGTSTEAHALLWSGTSESVVDLHPNGYIGSLAYATDGSSQVGAAGIGFNRNHAMVWSGSAQSAIDLHPGEYDLSEARGVWGDVQVGSVLGTKDGQTIGGAVVWHGTAASVQLLPLPKGHSQSGALAVHGSQVVGSSNQGAILWDIDLWTATFLGAASVHDTNGAYQVGISGGLGEQRAIRWSGTEASALDLHQFVPSNIAESRAMGIDENGVIAGWGTIVGVGSVPIVWTPIPEPSTALGLAFGILILLTRKRKHS